MRHEDEERRRRVDGSALGDFLRARREGLTPHDVGLTPGPGMRRTPGLRREEVAVLAGVSENYYTRLERGRETNPSPAVVDSLARTLRLAPDEHAHLRSLAARVAGVRPIADDAPAHRLPGSVPQILEALRPFPAYVLTRTGDLLAANPPAEALFPGMDEWPPHRRNIIRYLFLAPAARTLYPEDWEVHARHCIAGLRSLAGTDPQDAALAELVEELRRDSEEFAALWQAYDVRTHAQAVKVLHHSVVGRVAQDFQAMSIEGTPGQRLSVYSAAPGTPEHEALVALDGLGAEGGSPAGA